jgi:uncharacterized protein
MSSEAKIKEAATRFGISEIYAFGSRAQEIACRVRGELVSAALSASDVDIGVMPEPGRLLSVRDKVRLAIVLEDFFDVPRVDLLVIPEVDAFLAVEIVRGELLYCRDLDQQAETELYILARAGDLAHYEWERIERILSGAR